MEFRYTVGEKMLNDEERKKILELDDEGWTPYSIGKLMNRDPKTISNFIKNGEEEIETPPPKSIHRRHKSRSGRPLVQDPSPQLKSKRELAEGMDLEVAIEERVRELKEMKGGDTSMVKEKEDEVRVDELSVRGLKAKKEIRELVKEDTEERRRQHRKELLEKTKEECLPSWWRKELPPSLLLITLTTISAELSKLDLDALSFEEAVAFGVLVRSRIFGDPQYSATANFAGIRGLFKLIDEFNHQEWKKWREASIQAVCDIAEQEGIPQETTRNILINHGAYSFDDFMRYCLTYFFNTAPQKWIGFMRSVYEFLCVTGRKQEADGWAERLDGALNQLAQKEMGKLPMS